MADFNDAVENGAERIVKAWEIESDHRRAIERLEQRSFYRDAMTGKIFALIFVLSALALSGWAAWIGAQWLGAILGAGTIGTVVWAFVSQRQPKS